MSVSSRPPSPDPTTDASRHPESTPRSEGARRSEGIPRSEGPRRSENAPRSEGLPSPEASLAAEQAPKRLRRLRWRGTTYHSVDVGTAYLLLLPAIAFTIFTFLIPMIRVVALGFTNFNMSTGKKEWIGLTNYTYLLHNDRFWQAMKHTLIYAAAKLTIDTALALAIALLLDTRIPGKRFFRWAVFAPVVVPVVASSLIWIWFYDPAIGPFNQILGFLGLPKLEWLYDAKTALMSILIFSIWKGVGYNVILFLSGLQNISDTYIEAAHVDGATSWQIFRYVKLPLLRPIIAFVMMIGVINSFKVFTEINVMTPDGGPLGSTTLIVNYIHSQGFSGSRMGRASAASLLLFLIILVLTLAQRLLRRRQDTL